MAISIQCPSCGSALQVRENLAGKSGKCPKCAWDYQFPRAQRASGQSQPGRRTPGNRVRVRWRGYATVLIGVRVPCDRISGLVQRHSPSSAFSRWCSGLASAGTPMSSPLRLLATAS